MDGKKLASHYQISLNATYAIIKQAKKTGDTTAKKMSGRKKVLTPLMVEHIVKQDQLSSGTTLRTGTVAKVGPVTIRNLEKEKEYKLDWHFTDKEFDNWIARAQNLAKPKK
jgi:transposase